LKPHNSTLYKNLNEDDHHNNDNFLWERRRQQ
jgi:hypothetical protein